LQNTLNSSKYNNQDFTRSKQSGNLSPVEAWVP